MRQRGLRDPSAVVVTMLARKVLLLCCSVTVALVAATLPVQVRAQAPKSASSALPHVGARLRYSSLDRRYDAFSSRVPVNVEYVSNAAGSSEAVAWAFPKGCTPNASTSSSANFTCGTNVIGPQVVSMSPQSDPSAVQSFVINLAQRSGADRYAWYATLDQGNEG